MYFEWLESRATSWQQFVWQAGRILAPAVVTRLAGRVNMLPAVQSQPSQQSRNAAVLQLVVRLNILPDVLYLSGWTQTPAVVISGIDSRYCSVTQQATLEIDFLVGPMNLLERLPGFLCISEWIDSCWFTFLNLLIWRTCRQGGQAQVYSHQLHKCLFILLNVCPNSFWIFCVYIRGEVTAENITSST